MARTVTLSFDKVTKLKHTLFPLEDILQPIDKFPNYCCAQCELSMSGESIYLDLWIHRRTEYETNKFSIINLSKLKQKGSVDFKIRTVPERIYAKNH